MHKSKSSSLISFIFFTLFLQNGNWKDKRSQNLFRKSVARPGSEWTTCLLILYSLHYNTLFTLIKTTWLYIQGFTCLEEKENMIFHIYLLKSYTTQFLKKSNSWWIDWYNASQWIYLCLHIYRCNVATLSMANLFLTWDNNYLWQVHKKGLMEKKILWWLSQTSQNHIWPAESQGQLYQGTNAQIVK